MNTTLKFGLMAGMMVLAVLTVSGSASALPGGDCNTNGQFLYGYDAACTGYTCDMQGQCTPQFCVIHRPNDGAC